MANGAGVRRVDGSIATHATGAPQPAIPLWELLFKNIAAHFMGSDDLPPEAKAAAARDLNAALAGGWSGLAIAHRFPLSSIAEAHQQLEHGRNAGRVVLLMPAAPV